MKKIFLVLFILILTSLSAFAEYKPIPKNLSKQYKKEMEYIINTEYPKAIKNVDEYIKNAKNLRDNVLKNGFNLENYINLTLISEVCIPAADLDLYAKLMKVTQEKYLGTKYQPLGTDSTNPIYEYLYPYIKDNNVNQNKLTKIILYENKQIKIIEEYIKQVEKLRP